MDAKLKEILISHLYIYELDTETVELCSCGEKFDQKSGPAFGQWLTHIEQIERTEKAAQPDICPTCGSDGPRRRMAGDPLDFSAHDEYCNDDWHFKAQPAKASQPINW